jgi:DNA phosphorothioation system restriction enzyme
MGLIFSSQQDSDRPEIDNFFDRLDWAKLAAEYRQEIKPHQLLQEPKGYYQPDDRSQPSNFPRIPPERQLRDYQRQAVVNWLENRGRGILKMATGSGKTIVALAITAELYQKISLQLLVVVCPYRHLVTQWAKECENFNLNPILAFESVRNWQSELSNQLYNLLTVDRYFATIITTNSTFISDSFQSQINFFPTKTLVVGDEVHNLGSERLEACLPRKIGLRLGLSATPERHYDEEGTDAVLDYFGKVLQPEFTLADAIYKGALVRYSYHPILVELTDSEAFAYAKLTKRIGWAMDKNSNLMESENLKALLMQRSRLIGSASNKLNALRDLMKNRLDTSHTLFYCGDGRVDNYDPIYSRQLAAVTRILGTELGYRVHTYTAETPIEKREILRQQFESGELQGLVAIRCLDEGIDIPAIQTAVILASSSNPRQFIQRRGRILRPHPQKQYATLFDTIVLPPELDRSTWEVEKNLLRKELKRSIEFAELADNATIARQILIELQDKYGL